MKINLKLEQAAILLASLLIFNGLNYSWWYFLLFFLSPDLGMLGYLINNKIGAISYNLFHHQGIAIAFLLTGYYYRVDSALFIGSILLAHSSFDRLLGYGLKYNKGFKYTHLGNLN